MLAHPVSGGTPPASRGTTHTNSSFDKNSTGEKHIQEVIFHIQMYVFVQLATIFSVLVYSATAQQLLQKMQIKI